MNPADEHNNEIAIDRTESFGCEVDVRSAIQNFD